MKNENVNRYYDRTRRDYNRIWHTNQHSSMHMGFHKPGQSQDQAIEQMIYELAARAKIRPDDVVVDCGCGVGGSAIWLAKNIGCHLIGIDTNLKSLEIAAENISSRNFPGIGFLCVDYGKTSIPTGSIDVVWFLESLCHAQDKKAVLAEAARVLRPGGRIVVADGFRTSVEGPELDEWLAAWSVPNLATPAEFGDWLYRFGFKGVQWEDITGNVMPSVKRLYRLARLLYPLGVAMQWLGLRTATETANIRGCIQLRKSLKKGQCCYGIFSAERS